MGGHTRVHSSHMGATPPRANTPPPLSRTASWDHMAYLGLVASSATGGSVSKRVGPGRGGWGQWRSGEGREKGTVGIQGWEGKGKAGKETEANGGRKQEERKRTMDDTRRRRQTLFLGSARQWIRAELPASEEACGRQPVRVNRESEQPSPGPGQSPRLLHRPLSAPSWPG